MTEPEFRELLEHHDWGYQYSDDKRAFAKGEESAAKIRSAAAADPILWNILQEFKAERGMV